MRKRLSIGSRCDDFAQSIKPREVFRKILDQVAFPELVQCFQSFSSNYVSNMDQIDISFIQFSRSTVIDTIQREGLLDPYQVKLSMYKRLAEHKIDFVWRFLLPQINLTREQIQRSSGDVGSLSVQVNTLLCVTASQMFFAVEHCCKIACALGNVDFARTVASGGIVSHGDVYGTLKILSQAGYVLDFKSLSKLYAYAIETRMVADYTDFFHLQYDAAHFLFDVMIPAARHIFNSHRDLLFECAGV